MAERMLHSGQASAALDYIHVEVEPAVERLISIIQADQRRLVDQVNAGYGLTPEDIELLWCTAPPRMPVGR